MRFKPVPPAPDSLDFVEEVQRAVPLVPGSVDNCCTRVMSRTSVPSQDEARTWLTFLQALGLVRETERGFARTRDAVARESLRNAFETRVFGASEVVEILADAGGPLDADEVFERFADTVPNWERFRHPDTWRTLWLQRVERLLAWGALFGVVDREGEGGRERFVLVDE